MTDHRHEAEEILDTLDQWGDAGSMARCERVEAAQVHALLDIADRLSELVPDHVSYYPVGADHRDLPEIEPVRRAQEDLLQEVAALYDPQGTASGDTVAPSANELTAAYFDDLTACTRHTAHRWDFPTGRVVGGNTTDGPWEPCDSVGVRFENAGPIAWEALHFGGGAPVTFRYHDMDTQARPLEPPVQFAGNMYAYVHPDPPKPGDPVTVYPVEATEGQGPPWKLADPTTPNTGSSPLQEGGSLANAVLLTLVDEMVDNWHTRLEDGQGIHEYLGMTPVEYDHWVKDAGGWATTFGTTWFRTRHLRETIPPTATPTQGDTDTDPTRNATPDETPATPTGKQGIGSYWCTHHGAVWELGHGLCSWSESHPFSLGFCVRGVRPDLEGCVTHQAHWEPDGEACDAVLSDPYLSEHARGECRRPVPPTPESTSEASATEGVSGAAADALAEFLWTRDMPNMRVSSKQRYEYRCRAAAVLNGEGWAIRKSWPGAAYEIQTGSDWSPGSGK